VSQQPTQIESTRVDQQPFQDVRVSFAKKATAFRSAAPYWLGLSHDGDG
jgi:hypothetical protein